jgi:hypothetical protein
MNGTIVVNLQALQMLQKRYGPICRRERQGAYS